MITFLFQYIMLVLREGKEALPNATVREDALLPARRAYSSERRRPYPRSQQADHAQCGLGRSALQQVFLPLELTFQGQ
jgi:hypothetical protein